MYFVEVDIDAFIQDVHRCIDELIEALGHNASSKELKHIMHPYIARLRRQRVAETEEREYVSEVYYELSQLVSVDISFQLNRVMYGWVLAALSVNIFRKKKKWIDECIIVQTITNTCTCCGCEMKTNIVNPKESPNNEDMEVCMKAVILCKICGAYNLVFITEDGQFAHSEDYYLQEELPDHYTREQAEQRLSQIKEWN